MSSTLITFYILQKNTHKKSIEDTNDQLIVSKKSSKKPDSSVKNQKESEESKKDISKAWMFIFSYLKHFKKDTILISFIAIVSALVAAIGPLWFGKFIDSLSSMDFSSKFPLNFQNTTLASLLVLSLLLISSDILNYFKDKYSRFLAEKSTQKYRNDTFKALIDLDFSFHTTRKAGDISSKTIRARNTIYRIIGYHLPFFFPELLFLIISFFFAFSIHPLFSIVLLFGILLFMLNVYISLPKIRKLTKEENKINTKTGSEITETYNNALDIKKYNLEKYKEKVVSRLAQESFEKAKDLQSMQVRKIFTQGLILNITKILIFALSIFLVLEGSITIGQVITVNIYANMMFRPLNMLSRFWVMMIQGLEKVSDVVKILDLPAETYTPKDYKKIDSLKGKVTYKNVTFSYPKSDLYTKDDQEKKSSEGASDDNKKEEKVFSLSDINIEIEAGKKVAFVGKSGGGKTTSIDLIGGFYFPQKGEVCIDDIPTDKHNLNFLRKNIAYVSQDTILFNDTIENNIRFGDEKCSLEDVKKAAGLAHADEFINDFEKGYSQEVGDRGIKLSGGQKQRISIARAILRNPKILILDEPTSALDIESESKITASLKNLMQDRTTIIIAHRLSTVRDADTIFVFDKGRVVEKGNFQELVGKNGFFKKMVDLHEGLE